MPLSPGQILHERYRIDALIGQGGFGAVYRAWDLVQDRACACKENLDTRAEAVDQFGQEAVVLASLSHPNLPRVTDHFVLPTKGQYLVMDFVQGRNLASLMAERGGALPEGEVLPWIDQVCDALTYLHSQLRPIIHRDVKPQNIIITPAGRAMLVDFGTSKIADGGALTRPGGRAVTAGFSPPEQYGMAGHTGVHSDIYALGATLYAALTGCAPPDSVDRLQGNATLAPPRQLNPAISRNVETAILKAMEPDAAKRFGKIGELQNALAGGEAPLPVTRAASPPLPVTRRAEEDDRDRRAPAARLPKGLVALAAVVLLAALGAALYLGGILPRSGDPGDATPAAALGGSSETPAAVGIMPEMSRQPAAATAEAAAVAGPSAGVTAAVTARMMAAARSPAALAAAATGAAPTEPAASSSAPAAVAAPTATLPPIPTRAVQPTPTPVSRATAVPVPPATAMRIPPAATATPTRATSRSFVARPGLTPTPEGLAPTPEDLAPLPELNALGPAVLYELFNSDLSGWPVEDSASEYQDWEVSFNRGRYRIANVALDDDVTIYSAAPEIALRDFLLQADTTLIGSSGPVVQRLYFRCQDPSADDCYVADFDSGGQYALGRTEDGEYAAVREPTASEAIRIRPGETNTFAILAAGSSFTVYANGQPLRTVTDRTYSDAGFFLLGIGIPFAGDDAVVEFDNLFVFQLPDQAPPEALPEEIVPARVVLFERFDNNARNWDVGPTTGDLADTEYQVTDGALAASMTIKRSSVSSRLVPDLQVADFGLWVDATFTGYSDTSQVNILFRCQDDTADYCHRAQFATDGTYAISRWQGDDDTTLVDWTASPEIRTGARATNNFGVIVRGSRVQVFANDVLLRSHTLEGPARPGGLRLGVGAWGAGTKASVEFDNLLIVEDAAGP